MNKYLIYLKNPKIWFVIVLSITFIVSMIALYNAMKPTHLAPSSFCPPDKSKTTCGDSSITPQCADKCMISNQKWDCKANQGKGECVCTSGVLCNQKSECCDNCNTNDLCCDESAVITKNGKKSCCSPGTTANAAKTDCVSTCGGNTKPCDENNLCNQIVNLKPTEFATMLAQSKKDDTWRGDNNKDTIYFCSKAPNCEWNSNGEQYFPKRFDNGATSYYKSSDIFRGQDAKFCIPKSETNYPNSADGCYNANETDCGLATNCSWVSPLEILATQDGYNDLKTIMTSITKSRNVSDKGYYCGNDTDPWSKFSQKEQINGGSCTWQDCNNAIVEPGVVSVRWDESSGKCGAIKSTDTEGGIKRGIQCTGPGVPCSTCTDAGDFADCVKCTDTDTPCPGCTAGQYVPNCVSTTNEWQFQDCKGDLDNGYMVTNYKAPTGTTCDNTNTFCGNCPFGTNGAPVDYYSGVVPETRKSGNTDNGSVCVSDGQVWPYIPPPIVKYKMMSNVPDKGVACKECSESDTDCGFNTDCTVCNDGYVINNDKTYCVYKCTTDGSYAPENPNDNNSAKNFYTYVKNTGDDNGICYRNKLVIYGHYVDDNDYWHPAPPSFGKLGGAVINSGDTLTKETGVGMAFCDQYCDERVGEWSKVRVVNGPSGPGQATEQGYTFNGSCWSTSNDNNDHCYAPFTNDVYVYKKSSEGPEYMHMREKGEAWSNIGIARQCWTKAELPKDTPLGFADYNFFPPPDTNSDNHCPGE